MQYTILLGMMLACGVVETYAMQGTKEGKTRIRVASLSQDNLDKARQRRLSSPETPTKRPSPNTDKALEDERKRNALPTDLPSGQPLSPRKNSSTSPRKISSPYEQIEKK